VVVNYQNPRDMTTSGNGSIAVFGLQDSSGTTRFELYFRGGDNYYTINDANALVNSSGIPYTKNGLQVIFTLTSANTYNLQVQDLASGKWYTYVNRTLTGTSGNAIARLRFFYENSGTGGTACQDFFFNVLSVGGYSDLGGNYTTGACGSTTWTNGANAGQGPLSDGGSISGSATASLSLSNVVSTDSGGVYSVIVYNPYGAVKSGNGTLTVNPHPNLSLSETDATCNGSSNGQVTATFSNGTGVSGSLQVNIDGGSYSTQTSPYTFTGLAHGSHSVTVQDVDGCTSNLTITVNQPTVVAFTTSQVNESCNGQSIGSITVTASGGSGTGYTYSDNNGSSFQGGNQFTSLAAGTYNIVVKDSNGCLSSATGVTITQPTALSLSLGETDVTCNGGSNGMVTATFSGGTGTLQVKIDGGSYSAQTSPYTFTGLSAGSHMVTVQDANGCTTSQSITVNQPSAPTVTASSNAPFFQGQYQIVQGQTLQLSATTVSGATAYNWSRDGGSTFASGQTVSDVPPAGTHMYTVTVPTSCGTAIGTTPSIVVLTADASGVPDSWKTEHGYASSTPSSTVGANGFTLLQSYDAGLDPTNAASILDMSSASVTPSGVMTVVWQSQQDGTTPTRLYDFYDLTAAYTNGGSWSRIYSNIAPAGATTSTNNNAAGIAQRFYRVTIAGHTDDVATIGIAGVQMLTLEEGANYISMSTTQATPTLLSVLGTNLPQGSFESTATTVDIWDQNAQAFLVNNARYWLDTGATGWIQHNTALLANDVQLDPTKGFIVTIPVGRGAQTLYVPGFVPATAEAQTVQSNGYTVASSTYPQPITLTGSGLSNSVTGGISLNKSDNLLFFDPTTQLFDIRVWYYTGDDSWRNADASIATQELQPGGAFLIERRSRNTNLIWTNPVPYQVPLQGP
jgi:SprB-like repeat protein